MQVSREDTLLIVVVDLALIEHSVTDSKIEEISFAAGVAPTLEFGNIRHAASVGEDFDDGSINAEAVEIPFSLQDRHYPHTCLGVLDLKYGWVSIRSGPSHGQPVDIQAEIGEMQSEILQMNRGAKAVGGLLLYSAQYVVVETCAMQEDRCSKR